MILGGQAISREHKRITAADSVIFDLDVCDPPCGVHGGPWPSRTRGRKPVRMKGPAPLCGGCRRAHLPEARKLRHGFEDLARLEAGDAPPAPLDLNAGVARPRCVSLPGTALKAWGVRDPLSAMAELVQPDQTRLIWLALRRPAATPGGGVVARCPLAANGFLGLTSRSLLCD